MSRFWGRSEAKLGHLYARYAELSLARPVLMGLLLLVLCLPAVVLDIQFFGRVHAGLQDLLPVDDPTVRSLDRIHRKLGGKSHLAVIAHGPDAGQNRAFIQALGESLATRKLPTVRSMQWNVKAEREWLLDRSALLMARADFDALAATLDAEIHAQKVAANPFALDLDGPPDAERERAEEASGRQEQQRLIARATAADRFPTGFIEDRDGHTVAMLIWLEGSELELGPAEDLEKAVESALAPLRSRYPAVSVAFNGEVPNMIEEHAAILADLSLSSVLVFVLVGALIVFYFRSLRAVLTVVLALIPGLCFTFAIGRLTVGSLNSNSAFLGSIIAGNGINYPLLLLAYYRAVRHPANRTQALLLASRQALPGTFGAAATASAAYAGLSAAHFRGFSEFGWIGGLGMLTTWLWTFAAMPTAIGLLNPPRQAEERESGASWTSRFGERFYDSPLWPGLSAAAFVVLALVLSGVGVLAAKRSGIYEMALNSLRNRESILHGSGSWDAKMSEVFGVWLNPMVALVERPDQREEAASALRGALMGGDPPLVERIETVETFVPAANEQARRLAVLRRAQRLKDSFWERLPPEARPYLDRWLQDRNLLPITEAEVPEQLLASFRELDGRTDRVTLVYPSLRVDYGDARRVLDLADHLTAATLPPGTEVGGSFLFMAVIIRLVQQEAPKVVVWVCLLVALALLPIFARRPERIPACVVTIAAVALLAQSVMLAFGVRVNMFNFAAVPITIGVGSDYVVNLYGAMDAYGVDARRAAARMGGAILLCSLTTVVGYLSLVFAQSGALRTFGWAAVLGEVMAVSTVLLVIPAVARRGPACGPRVRRAGSLV